MDHDSWKELGVALLDHCNSLTGASLALEPVALHSRRAPSCGVSQAINALKLVISNGRPVLCSFGGFLDHYTVLSGYSEQRLSLFDSCGLRWVEQRSVGWLESSEKRHWLGKDSAVAVIDNW
jgi:hypothetical protein